MSAEALQTDGASIAAEIPSGRVGTPADVGGIRDGRRHRRQRRILCALKINPATTGFPMFRANCLA
jgi:hypothetical protein